jgi:hypothetical protein
MFKAFSNGDSDSESDNHESFSKAPAPVQIPIERILGVIDPDEVDDLRVGSSYYDSKWRTVIEMETCDSYEYKITNLTVKEAVENFQISVSRIRIISEEDSIKHGCVPSTTPSTPVTSTSKMAGNSGVQTYAEIASKMMTSLSIAKPSKNTDIVKQEHMSRPPKSVSPVDLKCSRYQAGQIKVYEGNTISVTLRGNPDELLVFKDITAAAACNGFQADVSQIQDAMSNSKFHMNIGNNYIYFLKVRPYWFHDLEGHNEAAPKKLLYECPSTWTYYTDDNGKLVTATHKFQACEQDHPIVVQCHPMFTDTVALAAIMYNLPPAPYLRTAMLQSLYDTFTARVNKDHDNPPAETFALRPGSTVCVLLTEKFSTKGGLLPAVGDKATKPPGRVVGFGAKWSSTRFGAKTNTLIIHC